ncbi:MAG TPA: cation-translocating P-type ATPase [Blastocatellia bacterium]|nr:cation-translocating P-type ATPase [Blastocatellia bacterium]
MNRTTSAQMKTVASSDGFSLTGESETSSGTWHALPVERALERLKSGVDGLTDEEAARRLIERGPNQLQAARRAGGWQILFAQFKNLLIVILLVATALSFSLGHTVEALAITVIIFFAIALGFAQEYRAERALESLRRMAAPLATVVRHGIEKEVPARDLVPGDIILLAAGDKVPSDGRLIEAINLQIEEAALTGESVPVVKQTAALSDCNSMIGDRTNMAYAGTAVTYGRGRAVVTATGMETEFGKIAQMLTEVETARTPLQANLDKVGRSLARVAFVVVAFIIALGIARGQPLIEMIIFGLALAVAVVPEALPAVVTISLALGVKRMVKRNALVRRLAAVETLGATSVICTDKTGTLTKDEMTVRKVFVAGRTFEVSGAGYEVKGEFSENGHRIEPPEPLFALLRAAALVCDARFITDESNYCCEVKGDPTEKAIVVAAAKAGLNKNELETKFPRVAEIPFSPERKRMTTFHCLPSGTFACSKGAPEIIIRCCAQWLTAAGETILDDGERERLVEAARRMANEALRVLAVACRRDATIENAERDMTFIGLIGMIDPPRPEAKAAVQECEQAGIKVMMITGDHPLTARAVAADIGLLEHGSVMTGAEFEAMNDAELEAIVEKIAVCARVSPALKLRVVAALQARGHVVAMTGDGVNDAPALKKADIGIAMGITGTDVTREAAAMTLTDDNFASIVAAVEEGRAIFSNIKKYLMYLLSSNIGEIGVMAAASLAGLPLPLSAAQILYVNLATDGLPALALAIDPPEPDLMRRPPRNPRAGLFSRAVITLMLAGGLWSTIVNLSLFIWTLNSGRSLKESMTMTFVSLLLIQFFKAYNFRSDRRSMFRRPFNNRWLNLAIGWELIALALILYVPFLNKLFDVFRLTIEDWLIIAGLAFTVSPVLELVKWMARRE